MMGRYKKFAQKDNKPQIVRSVINPEPPEGPDAVYEYWDQRKMTSAGSSLNI